MAMAMSHRKKEVRTSLHMNFLFFLMSVVVLMVVGASMWKDTHPEWLTYQKKFSVLERQVLSQERADLVRQIDHPDYVQDYQKARQSYLAAKSKFDDASSTLEGTQANIEEMSLRLQDESSSEAGGGGQTAAPSGAPATKSELDNLDKEFGAGKASGSASAPQKGAEAKASDKELAELDKEFPEKGGAAGKPGSPSANTAESTAPKASKKEMDELDKEFADTGSKQGAKSPSSGAGKGSGAEMDELDKEFAKSDKVKTESSKGQATVAAAPALAGPAFEEADLKVDQAGAESKLEAAQRDALIAKRTHDRELIGLPSDAAIKRQLAESKLAAADQSLEVAKAGVVLEAAKQEVKAAAQVARWAQDASTLTELDAHGQVGSQSPDRIKQLTESKTQLQAHIDQLNRNLRLVDGRLTRNRSGVFEVEQIYVERLGAIDRCTTCHKAVEEPGFENAPEPFRTHSTAVLRAHPIERFGCVSCHGGWGSALEKSEAHGGEVGKGHPLLVGDQVQASCGKCHGETRQLAGEETYLAGATLFRQAGCLGCHKLDLNQPATNVGPSTLVLQTEPPKVGPDLDRIGEKVNPAWLVGWLQNPQSHSIDARMPNLGLKVDEAEAISTYLLTQHSTAPPSFQMPTVTQERLAAGRRLVDNLGCLGCHIVRGEGAAVGPELTNIRNKVDPQWLYGWIQNPKAFFPNSRMPVLNLTRQQSEDIGNYLLSVGTGKPSPLDVRPNLGDPKMAELGSRLIAERGCAGCHGIKGFERISAPELTSIGDKTTDVLEWGSAKPQSKTLYDYIFTKLTDPRAFDTDKFKGKMPKFGLSGDDARTIAIYLMSKTSQELPPEYTKDLQEQGSALSLGRRVFQQHDCSACHRIAGEGGKVGPELTREGEMVQPSWLFAFLKQPTRIRWWQDARMPDYKLTDAEATELTEFFMALSNQPAPYEYTPPNEQVYPLALIGQKYFSQLMCESCHPLAGKQVVGGDAKKLGPDLAMSPKRLKKDWMLRFLRDPQAFNPGTLMPTYGKPDSTYQAIIDFLMKPKSP